MGFGRRLAGCGTAAGVQPAGSVWQLSMGFCQVAQAFGFAVAGLGCAGGPRLSANILKNAMGVGIPGTGMIGLPIAIALGALKGKSEYGLEVLKDITSESVEEGKQMIAGQGIKIELKDGIEEKLYIEVVCSADGDEATAIISGGHTNFVYAERNGQVLFDHRTKAGAEADTEEVELNLSKVYDFATTTPLDEIRFILEAKRLNLQADRKSVV